MTSCVFWLSARARFWFCLFRPRHEHKVSDRQSAEERVQRIHRSPRGDNGPAAAAPGRRVPAGPGGSRPAASRTDPRSLHSTQSPVTRTFRGVLWTLGGPARPGPARPAPGELVAGLCVCVCLTVLPPGVGLFSPLAAGTLRHDLLLH